MLGAESEERLRGAESEKRDRLPEIQQEGRECRQRCVGGRHRGNETAPSLHSHNVIREKSHSTLIDSWRLLKRELL